MAKKLAKRKIIRAHDLDKDIFERDEQQDLRMNKYDQAGSNSKQMHVRRSFPESRPRIKLHNILQKNALRMMNVPQLAQNDTPNSTMSKNEVIRSFLSRNAVNSSSNNFDSHCQDGAEYEPFALKFKKFTVRDFQNNTRLNIKNVDHASQWVKRDRMIGYWQDQVIQNHLPPIDTKKQQEMNMLKKMSTQSRFKAKKPEFSVQQSIMQ